jgi:hypothetical protein
MSNAVDSKAWEAFAKDLAEYAAVAKIPAAEAINKKARDFAFKSFAIARKYAPKKGEIRAAAKARGYRVKVRKSIQKKADARYRKSKTELVKVKNKAIGTKFLNWRALEVEMELAQRESSKGYAGLAFMIGRKIKRETNRNYSIIRRNRTRRLGQWEVKPTNANPSVTFKSFQAGLRKIDGKRNIVRRALALVSQDMGEYMERKQAERLGRTLKRRYN